MEPSSGGLTPLQRDFVRGFFAHNSDFFLTGGAALIGYHGFQRTTNDVDLFTLDADAFQRVDPIIRVACQDIGASHSLIRSFPQFRRYLIERVDGSVEVDVSTRRSHSWYQTNPRLTMFE